MNTEEFIKYLEKGISIANHYVTPEGTELIVFNLEDGALVTVEIE